MASVAVMRLNETVLSSLHEEDLVEFSRGLYSHLAVYIVTYISGDQTVVHVTGGNDEGIKQQTNVSQSCSCCGVVCDKAGVRKDNFFDVAGKDKAKRNNSLDNKKKCDSAIPAVLTISLMSHLCDTFAFYHNNYQVRRLVVRS